MQRPRHTSEFLELRDEAYTDSLSIPTSNKRQTRQSTRQMVATPQNGLNAMKYAKNSRLRPTSLERERTSLLSFPSSVKKTSGNIGSLTPVLATPSNALKSTMHQRELFTADRTAGFAMHNDKKWIQEKTHVLIEYLHEVALPGVIEGIGPDFFTRTNALRSISIKQFVGIINYFLQFIWRNRYVVGSNHYDDIPIILQRLNYPYPVNKSWLMTPNTQHSFGHVIVLFDYLMDFAPPTPSKEQAIIQQPELGLLYEFELTNEGPAMAINGSNVNIASSFIESFNATFHSAMLIDAAKGFELWDKQRMDEYKYLQIGTCDKIVTKRYNLADTATLEAEINRIKQELEELRTQLPPLTLKDEDQAKSLSEQQQNLHRQINEVEDEMKEQQIKCKQLQEVRALIKAIAKELNEELSKLQQTVRQQNWNVQQHDQAIEECVQLKHQLQVHERTVRDLCERNLNQQVMLSRSKKLLTEQLELYNSLLRDLTYSDICNDNVINKLKLPTPLHSKNQELQQITNTLYKVQRNLEASHRSQHKMCLQLEEQINDMTTYMRSELQVELNSLNVQVNIDETQLEQFELNCKQEYNLWMNQKQELDRLIQEAESKLLQETTILEKYKQELLTKQEANKQFMTEMETEHARLVVERMQQLDDYESTLDLMENQLEQLNNEIGKRGFN